MKILKTIAVFVGIVLLISVILNMLKVAVKTKVVLTDFNKEKNQITLQVFSNGALSNTYVIDLIQLNKTSVFANDYRVEMAMAGTLVVFGIYNSQNINIETKFFDFKKPNTQIIFNEQ